MSDTYTLHKNVTLHGMTIEAHNDRYVRVDGVLLAPYELRNAIDKAKAKEIATQEAKERREEEAQRKAQRKAPLPRKPKRPPYCAQVNGATVYLQKGGDLVPVTAMSKVDAWSHANSGKVVFKGESGKRLYERQEYFVVLTDEEKAEWLSIQDEVKEVREEAQSLVTRFRPDEEIVGTTCTYSFDGQSVTTEFYVAVDDDGRVWAEEVPSGRDALHSLAAKVGLESVDSGWTWIKSSDREAYDALAAREKELEGRWSVLNKTYERLDAYFESILEWQIAVEEWENLKYGDE